MKMFREWAAAVCFCAVACSLAGMMLPESHMSKVYKLLTSLVFLSCLISPILSLHSQPLSFQLDFSTENTQEIKEQTEEITQQLIFNASQEKIRQVVEYNLERIGVLAEKIEINIHKEEEDNIFFIEASITLNQAYQDKEKQIIDFLKKELDINSTLYWNEGDTENA